MSDKFKFLSNASSDSDTQEDSAQSFLDEKLAKNKFTIAQENTGSKYDSTRYTDEQADELDANGGPTVANASDDGDGSGTLAERYKKQFGSDPMKDLQAVGGDANAANGIYANIRSLEDDSFWKKQDLSNLMGKAGHEETSGVIIGTHLKDGGLNVNATINDGINFDNIQNTLTQKGWGDDYKQNAISQLGSSMLAAGGEKSIQHSPEIKQAKERVRNYEDDVLSGKVSEDIYGDSTPDQYAFDATKGAAGIGTPMSGGSQEQAFKATSSFLDNKKSQVKKEYQFQAQG